MRKVLIVEDVEMNVDLLVQLLEDEYDVVTARDGEEGVAKAASEKPALVLMDISLPRMDGYEATRQIKANPDLNGIIVIGLSAHAMAGDDRKALAAGCDEYLTKPIDDNQLFATLERYLQ